MRTTRAARREQTRTELVAAARRVFLRRGLHRASLDEIADDAGYTKGAVYSNFAGKDDLFLAVLDEHFRRRAAAYADVALDQATLEGSYRAVGRFMAEADRDEPAWAPLLLEFFTHAARHEPLRQAVAERRERFLDVIAGLIGELGRRHGVRFRVPEHEVAIGSAALGRGMAVERLLAPEPAAADVFEELHLAYMLGVTEKRP